MIAARLRAVPFLALALLAACSDGPTGPAPVRSVEIQSDALLLEDTTLQVGETLQLDAAARGGAGQPLTGRSTTWSSSDTTVATVSASGLVSARAVGNALIVARVESRADTLRLRVVGAAAVACAPGQTGVELQVGEARALDVSQGGVVCVGGSTSGAEYLLVPFHASSTLEARLRLELLGGGIRPVSGPPSPARAASTAGLPGAAVPQSDEAFHLRRLQESRREFPRWSAEARARRPERPVRSLAAAPPFSEGDLISLNAQAEERCRSPQPRTGRVVAVTQRAIVVADTSNPAGGFTAAEYRDFGVAFDTLIYPVTTANFGTPAHNFRGGYTLIFFTRAVNELTEKGSGSIVLGFFWDRDFEALKSCAGSNEAEMFYMVVPDPARASAGEPSFSKENIARATVGVLAHEYQHLINASRRAFLTGATVGEEVWLNEGLSHIAEELLFYRTAGLQPRQNVTAEMLRASPQRLDAFNAYAIGNFGRLLGYLREPEERSLMGRNDELPTRGASWAFLRYAADRRGGSDAELWRSLVDSPASGLANLRAALRAEPLDWMRDWTVSVYTDDAVPTTSAFQQPSWHFRSVTAALRSSGGSYPLKVIPLSTATPVTLSIKAGGAAFLRFGVAPAGAAAVRTLSGGSLPPPTLRLTLVRTR